MILPCAVTVDWAHAVTVDRSRLTISKEKAFNVDVMNFFIA